MIMQTVHYESAVSGFQITLTGRIHTKKQLQKTTYFGPYWSVFVYSKKKGDGRFFEELTCREIVSMVLIGKLQPS